MRKILILLAVLIPALSQAQNLGDIWGGYMITDSVIFQLSEVVNIGDTLCQHSWCSKERPALSISYDTYPPMVIKVKQCSKCGWSEF